MFMFYTCFPTFCKKPFGDFSNLLRSYSGECLGSSSDEERSELRYSIWIAEFRELVGLWTHAAFWLVQFAVLPVFTILSSVTGRSGGFVDLRARSPRGAGMWNTSAVLRVLRCSPPRESASTWQQALVTHNWFSFWESSRVWLVAFWWRYSFVISFHNPVSLKLPSEFKHISKWWKRNDKGFFK